MRAWRRGLGLRREVALFLPLLLVLLAGLSTFSLFSYRNSLELLTEERRDQAARLAHHVVEAVEQGGLPTPAALRQVAPGADRGALLAADGRPLVTFGDWPEGGLLAPLDGREPRQPVGFGPDLATSYRVAGFAVTGSGSQRRILRVDLPAGRLLGQRRSARLLLWVVVSVNTAAVLLVLFFLRHLLAPYERLLARAREVGEPGADHEDEAAFLVSTFERAVAALTEGRGEAREDDIASLERTLAPSLESGLLLLDPGGRVLALNAVGAALLEVSPPPPGATLEEALAAHRELVEVVRRAVDEAQGVHRREIAVRSGDRERTLGLTVHPLRRVDGSVRGFLTLFADLTEIQRQAREERLAESLAQLGELAAGVAHELRNSLATIRGYLDLLDRRSVNRATRQEYLAEIRREGEQLQRVLEDFLSFARPGTARLEEVDVEEVVRRSTADPALAGGSVRLRVERGDGLKLRGDAQLLERAIKNLLHNAVAAERDAGREPRVEVVVCGRAEGIEVQVLDRGPGLSEEVRERLFQPFVSHRPGGIGLGLATARRIVDLHGGRIRLEDRPEGGTRVVLFFENPPSLPASPTL